MFEELKLLDVLIFSDSSFLSKVVKFFIGKWAHDAFYVGYNTILHADDGVFKAETLSGYLKKFPDSEVAIARPKHPVIILNKNLIITKLYALQGRKYDFQNAFARVLYRCLRIFGVTRKQPSVLDSTKDFFCPEPLGYVLKNEFNLRVRPNVDYTQLEPEDYLAPDSETFEKLEFGYKCNKGVPELWMIT